MSWALTIDTFKFLVDNFPPGTKILELGSGEGTKVLLDNGFFVFSIEQDSEWAFKYHKDYILAPLKFNKVDNRWWFDPACLEGKLPRNYDLLLIDGPTRGFEAPLLEYKDCRLGILEHLNLFNLDVPILVDDVNRDPELELFNILSEGRESSIHGRFGIIR